MSVPILLSGPSGVFGDVSATADGWVVVYRELRGPVVLVWTDSAGAPIGGRTMTVPTGSPEDSTFPRLLRWRSREYVAYRAIRDGQWQAVLRECTGGGLTPERVVGRCSGNHPMAFSTDGWFAWQNDIDGVVHGLSLETGEHRVLRRETRGTGLARVEGTRVVFVDEARFEVPGMLNPVSAGACTVGEGPDGGLAVRIGSVFGFVLPGECMTPRVADAGARYAAITWGGAGVRLVLFTIAEVGPLPDAPPPPIGRPLWCGFFTGGPTAPGVWRTDVSPQTLPGNCYLEVATGMVRRKVDGRVVAQYVASEGAGPAQDVVNLAAAIRAAKVAHPGVPVLAYWTRQAQAGPTPQGADLVGVEAYREAGDSLVAFEWKLRAAVAKCPAVVMITQVFTSNPGLTGDLVSLLPVYTRVAIECRNVVGSIGFNGTGRATGLQDHHEVRPHWVRFAAGIPGTPDVPGGGDEFVEAFKVTIKDDGWGRVLVKGQDYHAFAALGNGLEVEFQKDANDKLRIAVYRNGVLQDKSGESRRIEVKG